MPSCFDCDVVGNTVHAACKRFAVVGVACKRVTRACYAVQCYVGIERYDLRGLFQRATVSNVGNCVSVCRKLCIQVYFAYGVLFYFANLRAVLEIFRCVPSVKGVTCFGGFGKGYCVGKYCVRGWVCACVCATVKIVVYAVVNCLPICNYRNVIGNLPNAACQRIAVISVSHKRVARALNGMQNKRTVVSDGLRFIAKQCAVVGVISYCVLVCFV